ncbi:globin-coupled sensor protein [Novosphingobium umbonatum]|uniref:Globin-coupled sensor protein n=2 Tax=Novosphingobium umbonatum TaxID=1908524 RepID=A0A437N227_9SPHN|nr:globin-coupled sensor protein [Novosphingobium umbonatum]
MEKRIDFFALDADNYRMFPQIAKSLRKLAPGALARFYERVSRNSHTAKFFPNRGAMDAASSKQLAHWVDLFEDNAGGLSDNYHRRASHIGDVHARIGLEPTWYTGGYATILEDVITSLLSSGPTAILTRGKAKEIGTLVKLGILDMDVALAAYFRAEEAKRQAVIETISTALAALAAGDLTTAMANLPEEYKRIEADFESMRMAFNMALSGVAQAADTINSGAGEILVASDNLASRTEQQAGLLEETSAAMNELTAGISEAARGATRVESSVAEAQQEATTGSDVVREAVKAMAEIETSATEITQIINVIDGIAFQTNLLALNAGVEAARAGDAGKGFAVVANEVRALAQRSGDAAKDIRGLIGTSVDQVARGVALVDQSGHAFTRIATKVAEISELAITIANMSRKQADNLVQINSSVVDMDRNTQSNAAMAEEATAAARSLSGQAEELTRLLRSFTIEGGSPALGAPVVELPSRKRTPPPAPNYGSTSGALALKPAAAPLPAPAASSAPNEDWSEF